LNLMRYIATALVGVIVAAFVPAVSSLLADDIKAWIPKIIERLIKRAAMRLPEDQRVRFAEEWRSHVNDTRGDLNKLVIAAGFLRAARRMARVREEAYARILSLVMEAAAFVALALLPIIPLLPTLFSQDPDASCATSILWCPAGLLCWMFLQYIFEMAFGCALRANLFLRRVLVIDLQSDPGQLVAAIDAERRGFFEIATATSVGQAAAIAEYGERRIWGVILPAKATDAASARQLLTARLPGLRLYSETEFWERKLHRINLDHAVRTAGHWADETWVSKQRRIAGGKSRARGRRLSPALHRLVDIEFSLAFLLFCLPLMLLTAMAIRLESAGPVLDRQVHVGLGGQRFLRLKFRSTRTVNRVSHSAAPEDNRCLTRVGAIIRKMHIDEIPQLINIMRGEMSFVGPRPETPSCAAELERVLPFYADRVLVKPGMIGWAEINRPCGSLSVLDVMTKDAWSKLSYDLYYVKHRTFLINLLILFRILAVLCFRRAPNA